MKQNFKLGSGYKSSCGCFYLMRRFCFPKILLASFEFMILTDIGKYDIGLSETNKLINLKMGYRNLVMYIYKFK